MATSDLVSTAFRKGMKSTVCGQSVCTKYKTRDRPTQTPTFFFFTLEFYHLFISGSFSFTFFFQTYLALVVDILIGGSLVCLQWLRPG